MCSLFDKVKDKDSKTSAQNLTRNVNDFSFILNNVLVLKL